VSTRGWTSAGLALVEQDDRLWTVAQAARFIAPAGLSEASACADIRWTIRRLNIEPVGTCKQDGAERRGRQPRLYRAIDLIRAYDRFSRIV
jgi:hypothetical protein